MRYKFNGITDYKRTSYSYLMTMFSTIVPKYKKKEISFLRKRRFKINIWE